jgi:type I restriction enzyme M protein
MFYTTDISVTLWILNMNKKAGTVNGRKVRDRTGEILFLDLRRWDSQVEEIVIDKGKKKKKTILSDEQIFEVKKIYHGWQSADRQNYSDVPELCKAAKLEEIQKNDYSLAPSKYVEFIDHDLEIDFPAEMQRIQNEMRKILAEEKAAQEKLTDAFRGIGYGID